MDFIPTLEEGIGPLRVASVDADVQDCIDAGVHICIAAGNNSFKIDIGPVLIIITLFSYGTGSNNIIQRKFPFDEGALMVGNMDPKSRVLQ